MYQAKVLGKNGYHFFDAKHDRHMRDHHESVGRGSNLGNKLS